jgi:nucleoside-diphosphate-sugar epimerase
LNSGRVLITGAGGFIGRWSNPALKALGYETHAVLSRSSRPAPQELDGATLHRCDLFDEAAVNALLRRVKPTHLLHFAWIATPGEYWQSDDNQRWLAASELLLRQFRRHGGERAVAAGTCAEYDWSRVAVCDEYASPLADAGATAPSAYAACKIRLHRWLAGFAQAQKMSYAWGRIFFQYGPYEYPQRLVPSVIRHLLKGQEAPCTHGTQVRSFLHVADLGAAFAQLLHSRVGGAVNMGADERIALADLIERIARKTPRPDLVRLGARSGAAEPPLLVPNIRRLCDEVKWRPRFSLDAGLTDTVAWWRNHLDWQPP